MGGNRGYAIALNMPPLALMDDALFDSLNLDTNGDPRSSGGGGGDCGGPRSAGRHRGGNRDPTASTSTSSAPSSPSLNARWHVRIIKGYTAETAKELSVKVGDVVEVVDNSKKWWNVQNVRSGKIGFVPSNFLETMDGHDAAQVLPTRKKASARTSSAARKGGGSRKW